MAKDKIIDNINSIFQANELLKDLPLDADFFDYGASSLTVVDLQIQLESKINTSVSTSELMAKPTRLDWTNIYLNKLCASA